MILQSLNQLYDRLAADPAYAIAPAGYSLQKIAFAVVIHPDGRLHRINDLRDHSGKKPLPIQRLVLGQAKPPGSGLNPCFLWDNSAYQLGYVAPRQTNETIEKYRKRAVRTQEAFVAFRERHLASESEINDPAFSAVCRFLEEWCTECGHDFPLLKEITASFGLFQLIGDRQKLRCPFSLGGSTYTSRIETFRACNKAAEIALAAIQRMGVSLVCDFRSS